MDLEIKKRPRVYEVASDYDARDVPKKVPRIIISYVDYVNRTVWFRTV